MHTFEYVYDELELLFDGSIRNGIEYRKLTQIVSMEMLIRIYGKILVNSFAIQESGDRTKDHGNSLRQIGRGVYLGYLTFFSNLRFMFIIQVYLNIHFPMSNNGKNI